MKIILFIFSIIIYSITTSGLGLDLDQKRQFQVQDDIAKPALPFHLECPVVMGSALLGGIVGNIIFFPVILIFSAIVAGKGQGADMNRFLIGAYSSMLIAFNIGQVSGITLLSKYSLKINNEAAEDELINKVTSGGLIGTATFIFYAYIFSHFFPSMTPDGMLSPIILSGFIFPILGGTGGYYLFKNSYSSDRKNTDDDFNDFEINFFNFFIIPKVNGVDLGLTLRW